MTLIKQISTEIDDFRSRKIQIVPALWFSQYQTLQQIFFYNNSKFQSGDTDDEGDRKYFLNINKNPCKVCSKSIDFDTKNIRLLTAGGGNPVKTWFMERDLKFWMRDKQFGKVLNRLFKELPVFGSVVLKIVDSTPYFVDLRNFVVEQSADDLNSSNYIIEVHHFTVPDFRKAAKKMNWPDGKVKEVIDKYRHMKDTSHITVWERYGEVEIESDGKIDYPYRRVFIADVGEDKYDEMRQIMISTRGVELSSEDWDGNPYWEFHMDKMAGRWLGMGVVESLFEPQIRQNELCNLQSKTTYWAALRIFQTRDTAVSRNLFADTRNGEVLNTDSEITQIDMSDRNLAFFNEEYAKWNRNRDELTFSYDVVQGERLPAGTPLGSAQIAVAQTLSYFEQIQENIAMDVKELIYEVLMPAFQKENSKEHTLRLVGQDLDQYIELVKNNIVNHEVAKVALKQGMKGIFPSNHDREIIEIAVGESIKQGKEVMLPLPKDFYKDVKYDIDIDITGESVDTRVRYATRFAILQAITADPTMTTDPVKRRILMGMAEDGGINPAEFLDVQQKSVESMMTNAGNSPVSKAGGGVSAPAMGSRIPGQQTNTVPA